MIESTLILSIIEFCKFVTITVSFVHLKTEINKIKIHRFAQFLPALDFRKDRLPELSPRIRPCNQQKMGFL